MNTCRLLRGVLAGALMGMPALVAAQDLAEGEAQARVGHYDTAISTLSKVARSDSGWMEAQRELARVYATVGRYDEAERVARAAIATTGAGRELYTTLGEVVYTRGRVAAADSAFHNAMAAHASDSLSAAVDLAILHYNRGEHAKALGEFERFIDIYNTSGGQLSARDLMAVGIACRYLGERDPQLFKDALKAFDQAIAADPEALEPKRRAAELFLEKYNGADAEAQLDEVLKTNASDPQALLDAARRAAFEGQGAVDSLVTRALAVNPKLVDALVFRSQLRLELEDVAAAQQDIDRALQVNPVAPEALAALAGTRYMLGDMRGYEAAVRRSLDADSTGVELYNTLAELSAQVRRYREAADFAKRAVGTDARNWRGYGILGMNELRLGDISSGRKDLETSFAGDPYNVWIKNTLDLLDTFKDYKETRTGHFVFMIEKSESDILTTYLGALTERAYATFQAHYGYTPPPPIRIEVYRSHADFSVRTVGLAGLGALGVSFGTTLAFDSPAAKDAGPFNWGSTVWHELAHTFTLGLTDHRVPRWLSEGLSVYEEHHAASGWGFGVTPAFLEAFQAGKLVPVSRMNDGFMHPAYPEQVQFSYYQASLVCDLIARQWGDSALLGMLRGYKSGLGTDEVFQRVLGERPTAFDKRFDNYVRERFAVALAGLPQFGAQLAQGRQLFDAKRYDEATLPLERAKALFPEYGGDDSPYWYLAKIHEAKGELRQAADELGHLLALSEANYPADEEQAAILEKLGDKAGAAAALERGIYVNPFELPVHRHLADLYEQLGDNPHVIRERLAIVALAPVDRAEAYYRLALAYHAAGDQAGARHAIIRSLEEAPNYAEAQKLLLVLHGLEPEAGRVQDVP